jgi:hypothetical protein
VKCLSVIGSMADQGLEKEKKDETRLERVTYRTAAGCSTPELFVRGVSRE